MNRKLFIILGGLAVLLVVLTLRIDWETSADAGSAQTETATISNRKSVVAQSRNQRADAATVAEEMDDSGISAAEKARMRRMGENFLKPPLSLDADQAMELRAKWADRFAKEPDPLLRQEIVTEMIQLDDALTIKLMTDLLSSETDATVREQLVLILGCMKSTAVEMPRVAASVYAIYQQSQNLQERTTILDVMSNLPTQESVQFMEKAFFEAASGSEDYFHAAGGLFKLAPRMEVDPELIRQVTENLRREAQFASSERTRLAAIRALAAPWQDNKAFLQELLAIETHPEIRKFLTLASQQFPTE